MNDIHVFSTLYYPDPSGWRYLRESAAAYGVTVHGYGDGKYPGLYKAKVLNMIDYLDGVSSRNVLYTDSADSMFVHWNAAQALETLDHYGLRMVMAAERNCHPFGQLAPLYPRIITPWKYLNAGCFLGEREFVIECLQKLKELYEQVQDGNDDQGLWQYLYLRDRRFAVDYECRLFQTMFLNEPDDVVAVNGCVRNKYFPESEPMILHFNGQERGIEQWALDVSLAAGHPS